MPAIWLAVTGFFGMIPDWLKKVLAVLIVLAIVFVAGNVRGKRIAREECEAAARRAQTAADSQDKQAGREIQQQDDQVTTFLTQQKKDDDAKIAKLEAQVRGKCLYDKSTADPVEQPHRMRPSK